MRPNPSARSPTFSPDTDGGRGRGRRKPRDPVRREDRHTRWQLLPGGQLRPLATEGGPSPRVVGSGADVGFHKSRAQAETMAREGAEIERPTAKIRGPEIMRQARWGEEEQLARTLKRNTVRPAGRAGGGGGVWAGGCPPGRAR
jgi:hypothetical protein